MVETHWQLIEEESFVSFINKKEKQACRSDFLGYLILLSLAMLAVLYLFQCTRQSNIDSLQYRYGNRKFQSSILFDNEAIGKQHRLKMEKLLEKDSAYQEERKQIVDTYQSRRTAAVVLYLFLGFVICCNYISEKPTLKDKRFLYIKGVVLERDRYESSTDSGDYSKHQISLRLDDGEILKNIEVKSALGTELGDMIVIIVEQEDGRLPEIYPYQADIMANKS